MLIQGLCRYYDILSKAGKVLPEGYSKVKIHYLIALTEDGKIDVILNHQNTEEVIIGTKKKERSIPQGEIMPERTEKPGIDANIIEHRPLYIFGLNFDHETLTFHPEDRTGKAKKSHEAFVQTNLKFLEGLDSPLINAYRRFIETWNPEMEIGNPDLLKLGKEYGKAGFAFCLSGRPDLLLHEEESVKKKWGTVYKNRLEDMKDIKIAQCAITGQKAPIARIHNKIKGVYGGLATGSVLVGFNNESENSYGNEQSYNSGISEIAMKKYTEALNYLLGSNKHKVILDDMTIIFWAMNPEENHETLFMEILLGRSGLMGTEQVEEMLQNVWEDSGQARITDNRLKTVFFHSDVDFYMVGLKPNSSRLSVKFAIRKKYADVLWNIAQFQKDLQIIREAQPVFLSSIKKEMISPKSSNEKVNPALMTKLFEAIIYGNPCPEALLSTIVRRVQTDREVGKVSQQIRMGVIKACINRKAKKEELKVALDKSNHDPAYLCGRLFAVLEKLQQDASKNTLNRTIKDAYFASASSKPVLVFPKLIGLAQNHLKKLKNPVKYKVLIGNIIDMMGQEFPDHFYLKDQGKFMIGYYQQYQSFFDKKEETEDE